MAFGSKDRGEIDSASRSTARASCGRHTTREASLVFVLLLAALLVFVSPTRAQTHRIPFKVHEGHLFIPCATDDGPYECLIDTGAAKTVVDAHATARPALSHGDVVRGVDGPKETTMVNTVITIDGVQLRLDVEVMLLRPAFHSDVIIGEDILGYFASVTIDYKNSVVILKR